MLQHEDAAGGAGPAAMLLAEADTRRSVVQPVLRGEENVAREAAQIAHAALHKPTLLLANTINFGEC